MYQQDIETKFSLDCVLADMVLKRMGNSSKSTFSLHIDEPTKAKNKEANIYCVFKASNAKETSFWVVDEIKTWVITAHPKSIPETNLEWFGRFYNKLKTKYNGKWIAVVNAALVSTGDSFSEVHKEAIKKGFKRPFITRVLPERWENY